MDWIEKYRSTIKESLTEEEISNFNSQSLHFLIETVLTPNDFFDNEDRKNALQRLKEVEDFMKKEQLELAEKLFLQENEEVIAQVTEICGGNNPLKISNSYEFMEPPEYEVTKELQARYEIVVNNTKNGKYQDKLSTYKLLKEEYHKKSKINYTTMKFWQAMLMIAKILEWDRDVGIDSVTPSMIDSLRAELKIDQ